MKDMKNYLIALLAGLLALTLSTQNSTGATTKNYDALKLVEYQSCIDRAANDGFLTAFNPTDERNWLSVCGSLKP